MSTTLERFVYAVGAETDQTSFDKSEKAVGGLIAMSLKLVAVAGAAATSLFGLVRVTANNADEAIKTADALGLTVEQHQRLAHVADLNGIKNEKFSTSLERMVRRLSMATKGTGEAKDAIGELGITSEKLESMKTNEIFLLIADSLNELDSDADRVRLGFRIFGRDISDMLLMMRGGSKAINEIGSEMDTMGLITEKHARLYEEFNDDLNRIWKIFVGITIQISNGVLPAFLKMVTATKEWALLNREIVGSKLDIFIGLISDLITMLWNSTKSLGVALSWVVNLIGGFDKAMQLILSAGVAGFLVTAITGFIALSKAIAIAKIATIAFGGILKATKFLLIIAAVEDIIAWVRGGNSIVGSLIGSLPDLQRDFSGMFDEILADWDWMVDGMIKKFKEGIEAMKNIAPTLVGAAASVGGAFNGAAKTLSSPAAMAKGAISLIMDSGIMGSYQQPTSSNTTSNVQNVTQNISGSSASGVATLAVDELRVMQQQMQSGVK